VRILFLLEQLSPGGAEFYALRKGRYFLERGHAVSFASAGGVLERDLAGAGIPHLELPTLAQDRLSVLFEDALGDARRLARWLATQRIEVISAFPSRPFLLGYHIARDRGIPTFLECLSPTHFLPVRQAALAREIAEAGRLYALERGDAEIHARRLGFPPDAVNLIPNPVDTSRFCPGKAWPAREALGIAPGDFVLLTACRLDEDKARYVRWLMSELPALEARTGRPIKLLIAGDGRARQALESEAGAGGPRAVHFLGMVEDLETVYRAADAFVGMGTTVIEAAACGTPVVVANALSLLPDEVGPDEAAVCTFGLGGSRSVGHKVDAISPGPFSAFLEPLLVDDGLRAQVAQSGREAVLRHYALDTVMARWEAAFEEAVASSPRPRARTPARGPDGRRVLFVSRPDALSAVGGDTVQMLATKAALELRGLQVELSLSPAPSSEGCDLAHIFNLQFAQQAWEQARILAAQGVPTVMSPIFWDHAELEWVTEELRQIFSRPQAERSNLLAAFARRARKGDGDGGRGWRPSERLAALREAQRKAAACVDLLLPNSSAEISALCGTLGPAIAPCRVVINAVDAGRFGSGDPDAFAARYGMQDFVMAAARWDPRKNLLLLCEALRGTGLPLVLIGQRPNAEYEALVRSALPPGSLAIDHLSPAELADAFAAARVHALPSWFETPGLSSMEAAISDCAIVVGNRAAEREYFGDEAYYCDPADVASIRQAIIAAWNGFGAEAHRRATLAERIRQDFTWDRAADATWEAYREVLGATVRVPSGEAPGAAAPVRPDFHVVCDGLDLAPETLGGLVDVLAADPRVGAVGPLFEEGPRLQDARLFPASQGAVRADLLDTRCLVVRNEVWEALGGLDGVLVAEHADLDLAWRIRDAGYTLRVATNLTAGAMPSRPQPAAETIRASADHLARKLEAHFGRGRVPRKEALWGDAPLPTTLDIWGPKPTRFRLPARDPAHDRVAAAFAAAFTMADPVALQDTGTADLPEGLRGIPGNQAPAARKANPIEVAAASVATESPETEAVVELVRGTSAPGLDPDRTTPALLRQIAGFRPEPAASGLTSVVLLAVDQPDYTRLCLDALRKGTREPFELIIVDGGVRDAVGAQFAALAGACEPHTLWLRHDDAKSASALLSLGLAAARGDYIALLKGDTVVPEGWLTYLLRHLRAHPAAGLVAPRANAGPGLQPVAALPYDSLPEMEEYARSLARRRPGEAATSPVAGSFAAVLPRLTCERVGAFDPAYPSGSLEAIDYCLRAQLAGLQVILAEDVFVHHFGLQPPVAEAERPDSGAAPAAFDHFRARWGDLPDTPDSSDFDAILQANRASGSAGPPVFLPLPRRSALRFLVTPLAIAGLRGANLLFGPDWSAPDEPWATGLATFARTFHAVSDVALLLFGLPDTLVPRISQILDEARPLGDGPDVLVLPALPPEPLAVLSSGIALMGGEATADLRRSAEMLSLPEVELGDPAALATWAQSAGKKFHAGFM
jgi:glycosyltransferase involved in cell wall biosynthesis/GT2 family glycosyltransferase